MQNNSYQIDRDDEMPSPLREIRQVFNDWVERLLPHRQDSDISEYGNQNQKSNDSGSANSDAVFIGWQNTPSGEIFPLYNVTAENHPLYRSTVSDQTLRKQNLKIPQTPPPERNVKSLNAEK
ncbi:MAG: hypothetical protein ABR936_13825 [Bacteroidota bacterium]|jgi:hypothetical protein